MNNPRRLLTELVSIPSEYPQEKHIGDFVADYMKRFGFEVTRQKVSSGRWNILAEKGSGSSYFIFGHLDTVKLQEGWKTEPYQLTAKGDKLYGIGSWDMKAGLAAILTVACDFIPKHFKLKLAFVVDEENISLGMHTLVKSGWLEDVKGAIALEPGFDYGEQGIVMGRVGRSVYTIEVKTEGGHVYLAERNANAIVEATKVVQLLSQAKQYKNELLGNSLLIPRYIVGGEQSMSLPSTVTLEIESQLVPPQTPDVLLDDLKQMLVKAQADKKINAHVTISYVPRETPFCEPFTINPSSPFAQLVTGTLKSVLGKKPIYYYRRSVADENRIACLGIPVVTIGPKGGNAHVANEWVSAKSLGRLTIFLQELMRKIDNV